MSGTWYYADHIHLSAKPQPARSVTMSLAAPRGKLADKGTKTFTLAKFAVDR